MLRVYSISFPDGPVVNSPPAYAGDSGSIPGLGRSPEEGNGNPLQSSCLKNPMGRGAWWAIVHGVSRVRNNSLTKLSVLITFYKM